MNDSTPDILRLCRLLCAADGVSGRESGAFAAAEQELKQLGPVTKTALGSLLCTVNECEADAPHLLLEAHLDQIGLVVTRVEEGGFLRFAPVGGIDPRWLPASPVMVHAATGDFPGIITSVPPHLAGKGEGHEIKAEELLIDTGFPTESAKILFAPGDNAVFDVPLIPLQNGRIAAVALDDRAGCAAVLLAAAMVAEEKPRARVSVLLSSMEEVGGFGAMTGAFSVLPDYAVAVDVSFGDGFGLKPEQCGALGDGPMLGYSPLLNRPFGETLRRAAAENGIPVQREAMGGRTGTDADEMAATGCGIRCALLSIPQRSMHTMAETVDCADILNTAQLLALAAKEVGHDE